MIDELVKYTRSYRAFDESRPITKEQMLALVDLARKTASGMNLQPLRYRILSTPEERARMMGNCRFASSLGIKLPPEGGEPSGFILIFIDREVGSPATLALKDVGIAAQTMLLAAAEQGFGGCMLGSFNAERLLSDFDIPARYEPQLAIALGTPAERCELTEAREGDLRYFRDAAGTHFVPKRELDDIMI